MFIVIVALVLISVYLIIKKLGSREYTSRRIVTDYTRIAINRPELDERGLFDCYLKGARFPVQRAEQYWLCGVLMEACEWLEEKYEPLQIYSLPNLIFFCLMIDGNRIITLQGPNRVYLDICNDVAAFPQYMNHLEAVRSAPDVVVEIQENYTSLIKIYTGAR